MEALLPYFLGVNLLLLVQWVYYRLFLARQRRFQWNRFYLLGGMMAAILLPLIRLDIVPPSLPNPSFIPTLPTIVIGGSALPAGPENISPVWTALEIGWVLFGAGVAIALTVLLMRNFFILRLVWNGKKTQVDGCTLVTTTQDIGPASYFRYIFWNPGQNLDPQSAAVAMAHERCHSRQLHSLDLLFVEILKAFCWINPAIYGLRKDLRQTHEYLADQAALEVAGLDGIKRLLLLRQLGSRPLVVANYFHSYIKARMKMLTENTRKKALLHYILVLPLAALMVACTSLGHPLDVQTAAILADSPIMSQDSTYVGDSTLNTNERTAPNPSFINLDDLFLRAQMGDYAKNPKSDATVCLGHQPPVLNLDTNITQNADPTDLDYMPELLNQGRIIQLIGYPKEAKAQKIEGKVIVKVLVDETGHVIRYEFLKENHPLLRDAVAAHVEDLLFKPGVKEGKAAKWWVVVPFRFGPDGC